MRRRQKTCEPDLSETLTALLTPIGKLMLQNGLGVGDLIQAAKQAYVRAAIAQGEPRGRRVNASQLSVMTGLTRKEISALVSKLMGVKGSRVAEIREQRVLRVLRGWSIDRRFCNPKGKPRRLPIRGERRSFTELVRLYGGDVTPNSVLRELERMKLVAFDKAGELHMRPVRTRTKSAQVLSDLARLFPDFANTVTEQRRSTVPTLFFGFRDSIVSSSDQAALFHRTFSRRATAVLQGVDQWIAIQSQGRSDKSAAGRGNKYRVGIGVYLVQSECEPRETTQSARTYRHMTPPAHHYPPGPAKHSAS